MIHLLVKTRRQIADIEALRIGSRFNDALVGVVAVLGFFVVFVVLSLGFLILLSFDLNLFSFTISVGIERMGK